MIDAQLHEDREGLQDYGIPKTFENAFSDPKQFNKVYT
jgi:hypothetical protein